jgi:hypothetical protein
MPRPTRRTRRRSPSPEPEPEDVFGPSTPEYQEFTSEPEPLYAPHSPTYSRRSPVYEPPSPVYTPHAYAAPTPSYVPPNYVPAPGSSYVPPKYEHPSKRTKSLIDQSIPSLAGALNNIIEDISQPQEVVDEQVQNMINQLNDSIILITEAAQKSRIRIMEAQEKATAQEMAAQEQQQIDNQIQNFKEKFNNLIDSDEVRNLNNLQRQQLFKGLTRLTSGFFTAIKIEKQLEQDVAITNRFREVWMIMIEVLGTYISAIKNQGPDVAKKTAAVMSAVFMFIGFLGPAQREAIASVSPSLATLINATYVSRPYIRDWLQAGAGVTMIYYFLKNAGIETDAYIENIGKFAAEKSSSAAIGLSNMFVNILGRWATSEYSNFEIPASQDTILTSASSTQLKMDELRSVSSNVSAYSVGTIKILLSNHEGTPDAVDPMQNLTDNSAVVKERLEDIVEDASKSISETNSTVSTQLNYGTQESQPFSAVTAVSGPSDVDFWFWDSNKKGGARRRRRHYRRHATKKYKKRYTKRMPKKGKKMIGRKSMKKRHSYSHKRR